MATYKQTLSIRISSGYRKSLEALSAAFEEARTFVLNHVATDYRGLHLWQSDHIEEAIRQAESEEFASDAQVEEAFARWRS